jgi:hypothetical protein
VPSRDDPLARRPTPTEIPASAIGTCKVGLACLASSWPTLPSHTHPTPSRPRPPAPQQCSTPPSTIPHLPFPRRTFDDTGTAKGCGTCRSTPRLCAHGPPGAESAAYSCVSGRCRSETELPRRGCETGEQPRRGDEDKTSGGGRRGRGGARLRRGRGGVCCSEERRQCAVGELRDAPMDA